MSGIEVAGLVLGALPAVTGLVQWYSNGMDMEFLADSLEINRLIFRNTLDHILLSVVSPHEAGTLLNDPSGPAWQDPAFKAKVKSHLGTEAPEIFKRIEGIHKTISKLQDKLPAQDGVAPSRGRMQRAKHVAKAFVHGPDRKASLAMLRIRVTEFRTLADDTVKLATPHIGLSCSLEALKQLDMVREGADCLYRALQDGWTCNCNVTHPANLQLDFLPLSWSRGGSNGFEFTFSFLFAPDVEAAQSDHWMVAEIAVSRKAAQSTVAGSVVTGSSTLVSSPISTTASSLTASSAVTLATDLIHDLCAEVNGPAKRVRGRRRRLSSISGSNGHDYEVFIRPDPAAATKTSSSIRFADTFSAPNRLSMRHKMKLALSLAEAVLQISATNWLKGRWTKENVLLVLDDANKPSPYISHAFHTSRRSSQSSTLVPASSDQTETWVKNATMFALGVFLLEVSHGRSIEDLASVDERATDGQPAWSCGPVLTAMRLAKAVDQDMGIFYAQAVDACLNFQRLETDGEGKPKDSVNFTKKVMKEIIEPLNEAARPYL